MPDPTPAILEFARRFRQQLLARERRAASAMVRYYGDTWRRLQPEIRALQAEVDGMRAAGEDVSVARIGRLDRLRSIEAQAQQQLLQFTEYADDAIKGAEREAIAAAERDAPALMRAAYPPDVPITITFDRMPRESVENLVGFLQDGSPLADLLADAVGDAADNFASTMVSGMAAGWNPRRLARALRSEFGMGLTQALKISRTEQLRAYRTTSLNAYRTSNVCTGWEWLATLSPRTCMACLEKDGTRYSLDQEFEDHVQGRCTPVPITKSYAEMGIDAPEPDFTREKGHDWFLRQEEGVQRRVLGDGKFDAWKDGQFKLEDVPKLTRSRIWGNSWTPKTLGELLAEAKKISPWKVATKATEEPNYLSTQAYNAVRRADFDESSSQAKHKAMIDIAARLKGDEDFERFVLAKGAELRMAGVSNIVEEQAVSRLIHQWALTSGDENLLAVALQRAAEDEFAIPAWHWSAHAREQADDWAKGHEAALRKFLRAMYDNTQEQLQADGIDSLFLWRGMVLPRATDGFGRAQLDMQPMSSFSARLSVARSFAANATRDAWSVVIATEVPRERIIGAYGTGFGCLGESEFVVLGGETEGWVSTGHDIHVALRIRSEEVFMGFIKTWLAGQP